MLADVRQREERTSFGANATLDFRRDDPAIELGQRQRVRIKIFCSWGDVMQLIGWKQLKSMLQHLTLGRSNTCDSFRDDSDKGAALA